jgi:hypothetical protein
MLVVYTAIIKNPVSDGAGQWELFPPPYPSTKVKYVCYTNDLQLPHPPYWELRPPRYHHDDPVRIARWCKVLAHNHFPEADISVWMDSNVTHAGNIVALVTENLANTEVAMCPHPRRASVEQDAKAIIEMNLDDPEVVKSHIHRLEELQFPDYLGLHETTVVFRRHTDKVAALNECWWRLIANSSRRDQLSFEPALWMTKMKCGDIKFRGRGPWNVRHNPFLHYRTLPDQQYRFWQKSIR